MKKTVLLLLCLSALTAQAYDGQGVIVGVIDGGMQYDHPTFRNAQGNPTGQVLD